ncbi:transporter [Bermanella sp. R86510]|uniref:transporter n=1 Tax=unclassified Bermanella TaxID=2627862 RepID=UPI0037CA800D
MIVRVIGILFIFGASAHVFAQTDKSAAREALSEQEGDANQEKSLEEVFEATENSYSLIQEGQTSLGYNMSYSFTADQRLDVEIQNGQIRAFDVNPNASHNLTNNFNIDYGYANNLTIGVSVPLTAKYDSNDSVSGTGLGDVSINARWQPYAYVPGELTKTVTGSFKTKTGDSPFTNVSDKRLSTGSGYYSLSGGMSISKVIDPVMLYGAGSLSYAIPETDVNQPRQGSLLQEVRPGFTASFSGGFAYSLSYDVSLSMSFQGSYTDKTKYVFRQGSGSRTEVESAATMSGILNMSLGIRVSPKTITNVGVGYGLTDDAPDILISLSMPIDINGLKAKSS